MFWFLTFSSILHINAFAINGPRGEPMATPKLSEENKELAAATLRSIALNYIKRKGPTPPKSMLRAIGQLKKRDDIVITRPDKGSGVVILDKTEYVSLLKESSINDETKFIPISLERPKAKGRSPKHYHPLLKKEKELSSFVKKILPKPIVDSLIQKGSRLAHLYGLPKTHKTKLAVHPGSCQQLELITTSSLSGLTKS